jgi:hypothetical protein
MDYMVEMLVRLLAHTHVIDEFGWFYDFTVADVGYKSYASFRGK